MQQKKKKLSKAANTPLILWNSKINHFPRILLTRKLKDFFCNIWHLYFLPWTYNWCYYNFCICRYHNLFDFFLPGSLFQTFSWVEILPLILEIWVLKKCESFILVRLFRELGESQHWIKCHWKLLEEREDRLALAALKLFDLYQKI